MQYITYGQENYVSKPTQQRVVNIILEKAQVALQKANYSEANELIASASEIAKDSTIYAEVEMVKVSYYNQTGQLENAKNTIDQLAPHFDKTSTDYARLLLLKSDFLMNSNLLVEAQDAILKSQVILAQNRDIELSYNLQLKQAALDFKVKKYNQAKKNLEELLPKLLDNKQFHSAAKAQLELFRITFIKGEYIVSKNYLAQSIALSEKYEFNTLLKESYLLNSELLKNEGEFENSITYLEKYTVIYNMETASVQKTASIIELAELKKTNKALTDSNNEKTQKLKGRDTSYILLCIFITLLSLLTLSLFKNNKLRAKSNDVLENKNLALIDERDRAKDATKIKADFLSTITHELRTPMYAVTGLTHLLLEKDPRNDQKEHLETLQSSGEYLLSLIDNILDFNKLEANKVELETIPFDLNKRVNDISLSLKGQATDRNNNLHIEYDDSIPSRLQGDPVKISQILINLIGNAIKFTKDGDIYIRVHKVNARSGKCLINFEIEDNGKGISEEKQIAIFENFTQEGSSTTREYGGTGLGLAIVKNLVTLMGGDIRLYSKVDSGSKFSFEIWFELPDSNKFYDERQYPHISNNKRLHPTTPGTKIKDVLKTPVAQTTNSSNEMNKNKIQNTGTAKDGVLNEKQATPSELSNKQILIVEDNKINQMITRKILEGKNFSCEVANNGEEAVQAAKSKKYDLILMDIHMPIKDGKEATREIRTFDREIPIIALTAVTLNESEKEFYEIGFDDIIPKPFKMHEFFEKIQKVFTNYEVL
ncbi:response regulator [Nonlabens sp. Ci31]|uniref:ATP-binding protein n=1 Tax=Nonlabens sp. Ci31 TaxID=2608253 RepID=UPI00146435DD|nr:ATP-binding protein [Nonlabens sp. Ci31]QJP34437.1 response regulator [Nonlabens sp. Ci31]